MKAFFLSLALLFVLAPYALAEHEAPSFTIRLSDIVSWQSPAHGLSLNIILTDQKAKELAAVTTAHIGKPLSIRVENISAGEPVIEKPLTSNGLAVADDEHKILDFLTRAAPEKKNTDPTP